MLVGDEIGQVGGRTEVRHGLFPMKGRQGMHIGKLRLRTPLDDRRDLLGIVEGPYRERNAVWGREGKRRAALRAEARFHMIGAPKRAWLASRPLQLRRSYYD